jgi:hypothetical protein
MTGERDVLGNLPKARPSRRSSKRPSAGAAGASDAIDVPKTAEPKAQRTGRKAAAKAARKAASKPRPAPPAKPGPTREPDAGIGDRRDGVDVLGAAQEAAKLPLRVLGGLAKKLPRP